LNLMCLLDPWFVWVPVVTLCVIGIKKYPWRIKR
jgi:hypothetical protein